MWSPCTVLHLCLFLSATAFYCSLYPRLLLSVTNFSLVQLYSSCLLLLFSLYLMSSISFFSPASYFLLNTASSGLSICLLPFTFIFCCLLFLSLVSSCFYIMSLLFLTPPDPPASSSLNFPTSRRECKRKGIKMRTGE